MRSRGWGWTRTSGSFGGGGGHESASSKQLMVGKWESGRMCVVRDKQQTFAVPPILCNIPRKSELRCRSSPAMVCMRVCVRACVRALLAKP
jgi:hypothetical protein